MKDPLIDLEFDVLEPEDRDEMDQARTDRQEQRNTQRDSRREIG